MECKCQVRGTERKKRKKEREIERFVGGGIRHEVMLEIIQNKFK
jgi:hypothetical protein